MVTVRGVLAAVVVAMLLAVAPGAALAAQPPTWNFQQADVPAAQPLGAYGKGVLVAVVDTWIDYKDSEFGGRVVDEADCVSGTCQDHAYAPDSCVHGTHVAGTIASADYGMAPQSDILAVQVLSGPTGAANPSAACSGSASGVAAGIDFAVAKGAKVINLSLADEVPFLFQPTDQAITDAVSNAQSHGVVVVIAAGNDSVPLSDSYGQDALVVAATGPSGQLASYSNSGPFVSIAAPSGDSSASTSGACDTSDCVLSTFPGNQLGLLQGTSMAAPHVSGLAALLLAQNPVRGLSNVFSTIESTATPLAGAGSGLINADKALQAEAAPRPTPAVVGSPAKASSSQGSTSATSSAQVPARSSVGDAITSAAGGSGPAASAPNNGLKAINGQAAISPATVLPQQGTTQSPSTSAVASGQRAARVPSKPRSWAATNSGLLAAAVILLAADLSALLWTRSWRRIYES